MEKNYPYYIDEIGTVEENLPGVEQKLDSILMKNDQYRVGKDLWERAPQ